MKKNPHGRILKREPKQHHLNTVPKSCSYIYVSYNIGKIGKRKILGTLYWPIE